MPKQLIKKLQIGFGLCFIILLITSIASYISVQKQVENRSKVLETQETILKADNILIDLLNAETGQRGFYLTNNESFLDPYYKGLESLPKSIAQLKKELPVDSEQSLRVDTISYLVNFRLKILEDVVKTKKRGESIDISQLELGKQYMDSCRTIIKDFVSDEKERLDRRSRAMNTASNYTSVFILAACLLSLVITFIFYRQLRNEFLQRDKLQQELRRKDEQLAKRLATIQHVAQQIAMGDYSVRAQEDENDSLGGIATSLNEMTKSLQTSFDNINQNEWKQTGLVQINEVLTGNKAEEEIANESLIKLVHHGECLNGAFYILEEEELVLKSSYGLESTMKKTFLPGEGMVGQVFVNKEFKLLENINANDYIVSFSSGQLKLSNMLWLPLMYKNECLGVIELGSDQRFEPVDISFFHEACRVITLELIAAKGRQRIQMLLEETQAQSEELQMQHSELENLNTELEAQTQLLQASEEELKVQQEELLQSNQELEERSKLLEEKNQLIAFRNQEIQKKAEELAVSTKYKSEFLANMSHELRTPLNSILLLSRLMVENDDENLNEDQIESAKVIQSSGSSLLSLIDEILDLSKIEAGKMELEFEPVNIAEISNDINGMFQPLAKEKGISFHTEISDEIPSSIETDKLRLDQILRNLLANAFKFTTKGEIRLTIDSDPEQNNFIRFSVKDTGIGISEENQQIIFEAFQQADGSTRRKFGGTGLGLSISREITKLLGGQISVESKLGEGSTFTISIPANKELIQNKEKTILEAIEEISVSDEIIPETIVEKDPFTLDEIPEEISDDRDAVKPGDKVILIVEDDTNFAKALLKYTHQQNYLGIVLVRGDQVLSFAERYQPLAILLDIQLPVKNGWDVMDELKKNSKTRHIPVHIMSSLQAKKESLKKGAIDFINKPIALEQMGQIFSKIEDALNRNSQKVLIVEENPKHAAALSIFLNNFNISSEIKNNVEESVNTLLSSKVNCVILDMGLPDRTGYETLEAIKNHEGLEDLPIIIFTGKNLSHAEEVKIKNYADSIVVKTAHSFQRILDEVGLFLHLVEENQLESHKSNKINMLGDALNGKTILIADDDVRNIFSLTKILEKYKVNVISAMNGKEALDQLYNNPEISVVLMDMMMPEMDGYQTIQTIRQNKVYKNLPIISVTAKAMTGDREKCIAAGASDYISKPVDKDQLLSLLRVWLYEI